MSSGGGFPGRPDRALRAPLYDPVPLDPPTRSASPGPAPPLPHQPPVGLPGQRDDPDDDPDDHDLDLNPDPALDIKPVHRFIPDSWKDFFRGSNRGSSAKWSSGNHDNNNSSSSGVRCSPPRSPPASHRDPYGGSAGSYDSSKELLGAVASATAALSYGERVEEYHQRYAYMKSWAGLLRILGCVELLLGAAVFACVCAYVHKDNEWFNMFGYSAPGGGAYGGGGGFYGGGVGGGDYYSGPKTPFVLVVAGLAWVVTVMVLVLGMTMYYRTILLDSNWWPLTEFVINLALAVLYMAAGIVYVRDTTRGGLCSYPVFNNGINGAFCRTEAGQTAAIIFLFVTMVTYLIGAIVSLKLWRHEANRRYRERYGQEVAPSEMRVVLSAAVPDSAPPPRTPQQVRGSSVVPIKAPPTSAPPKLVPGSIPSGHIPKPVVVPDYIAKYPAVRSDEARDQYRAVFNDQYAEYKELHSEVQSTLRRFEEMDAMMRSLPPQPSSHMEVERINRILQEYQRKKNDPTFLEKKERCEYLKSKLSHIKLKIQDYDKVMEWNDGFG